VTPFLLEQLDQFARRKKKPSQLQSCDVIQLDGYHAFRRKLPYLKFLSKCIETYHSEYSIRRSGPIYTPHRIAVSKYIQQKLKISSRVIYQGVPLPDLNSEVEKIFDVAIIGRFHPVKNHRLFLDICENLFTVQGKLRVLVIGFDSNDKQYSKMIQKRIEHLQTLGLQIETTGRLNYGEIYNYLQRTRTLLITSKSEGFGRMAIEAMACSVPVVANPVGGLLEIIKDGETGFLALKDNVDSFTHLTFGLLNDAVLHEYLGSQSREYVKKNFSIERMLSDYEAIYLEIGVA
jgi:glycosyltransferase involved in cell wall biosynthesis